MKNYSKQREAILNVLCSTYTHPTAGEIYHRVRQVIPNISLGTVYRNLAALSEAGEILSISVGDGYEHFDGNNAPHIHLHCRECSAIIDAPLADDLIANAAAAKGFKPETSIYVVYGVCSDCLNSKNSNLD